MTTSPAIHQVAVIGAGTMGQGIAQAFASASFDVTLIDTSDATLDRAVLTIESGLTRSVDRGRMTASDRDATLERITTSITMNAAAASDLVIEAVFENAAAKAAVFQSIGPLLRPDALLTTNTSSLSVSGLAASAPDSERFAGLHFFNPVPVLPLVEIVRGLATTDETVARLQAVVEQVGKTSVVVRDSPGFVVNRILIPMINEAITCLDHGVADRDAIDASMRLGANHPLGPLQLADLIGLDVCLDIMSTLHHDLGEDRYRPSPLLRRMVASGNLGRKTGRGFHDYGD